jgi:hypothetical protein
MSALGYLALGVLTFAAIGRLAGDDLTTLQVALVIALGLALLEIAQQIAMHPRAEHRCLHHDSYGQRCTLTAGHQPTDRHALGRSEATR